MKVDRRAFLREIAKIETQLGALLPAAEQIGEEVARTLRKAKVSVREVAIDTKLRQP